MLGDRSTGSGLVGRHPGVDHGALDGHPASLDLNDLSDDDEHDPEGSTIAFERAKVIGLARDAEDEVRELDSARERVASGSYGVCERCGSAIADPRLEALPAARRCIVCVRLR
ncbi:molecular chaperone DnaK [Rhodococcus sp. PAMC28707]|nr:molecular chaperone DnaK [Rhodococcus sp. PAMC28705]QCB57760.1 molecular chaperone DnaK [Rhodococcus sp. PAMC28707]